MKKVPWKKYSTLVSNFMDNEAGREEIIWRRFKPQVNRWGEDIDNPIPDDMTLLGLFMFNDFRTWPITKFELTGSLDKQSEVLLLSKSYLRSLNLLDSNERFIFHSDKDRFIHDGIEYEVSGDTDVAQASTDNLLVMIVLKRTNG